MIKTLFKVMLKDIYRKIRSLFKPNQQWLRRKLKRSWMDLDLVWETAILDGLMFYVEHDNGHFSFGTINGLMENYQKVTKDIPRLEAEMKKEWDKIEKGTWIYTGSSKEYQEVYGKLDELEEELSKLKTDVMIWCVKNRESLWS